MGTAARDSATRERARRRLLRLLKRGFDLGTAQRPLPRRDEGHGRRGRQDPIIAEYANRVRRQLGPRLRRLVLFGSRARGDAEPGSDYDILVLVDRRTEAVRGDLLRLGGEWLDRYGALVAHVVRSEEEWKRAEHYPFARNVAREGQVL